MRNYIINNLFKYASREGAKSLVIEGTPDCVALDYHFPDGEKRSFSLPKKLEKDLSLALRQVLSLAPDEFSTKKYHKIQDKHFKLNFYMTIIPSGSGEKIMISVVPKNNKTFSLKQLGLQENNLKIISKVLKLRSGLVLISSPETQGKSTTLYALLEKLNIPSRSLYFLGPKLESELDGINNLSLNKSNWEKVLNLDSEVIACEIETEEDFINATRAASTGRLVLATIAANSVWDVLLKYLKLKLPLKLKLDSLKLILNQRLVALKTAKRKDIGLFEILELGANLKKYLIATELDKTKDKFWEKIGRLAISEGYEPLISDYQKKTKNGLI